MGKIPNFQVKPEDMEVKDGDALYKALCKLMKRPVFRWY